MTAGPPPRAGAGGHAPLEPLVRRAFWVAIAGVVVVGLLAGGLALVHRRAEAWVHHSREVSRLARHVLTLSLDRETALRGYLLTRADTLLAIERVARDDLPAKLDSLVRLTADNPTQQRRARALGAAIRDWNERFAVPMLGGPRALGDTYPPLLDKPLFDVVRARAREFLDAEDALYRARRTRATVAEALVLATLVGGLGLVAVMLHRLRDGLTGQAHELDQQQHLLEVQASELEVQTLELEGLNDELRETNDRLLRAPLRALDGYGFMLEQEYADRLDQRGREHVARLRAGSRRMARLIDDLLALARVGRGELRRERVDLGKLARAAIDDLRRAEPGRQVEARVADGLVVWGDPTLLSLVMQNLLGNAWKFTGHREKAHLEVGIAHRDGQSAYFVRDDGAGFDPAYADRVFGAFQRLHDEEFEGTGIGLAIVHRIVARHGGHVWAESAPGRGATFFFTIPSEGSTAR